MSKSDDIRQSAELLVDLVLKSPGMLDQVRAHPEVTLRKLAAQATQHLPPPALVQDRWIYRIVVGALGLVSLTAAAGAIYLTAMAGPEGKLQIPDVLTALGAAAIGAMAGLLAPSTGIPSFADR